MNAPPEHTDPITILTEDHHKGLKRLEDLERAAGYIKENGFSFDAFTQIAEAIEYINLEIRRHNEIEEKYLFPLLDRHVNGPSHIMHNEHRELWKLFSRLLESVEDVQEGRIYATTIWELVESSRSIVAMLSEHIRKENEVLFPMARKLLTKEEYEQVRHDIVGVMRTAS
jgi:hemerythrin-like domain-containing protein